MNDHLGIGMGVKLVAFLFERGPQFREVINLPVEDNQIV